MRLIRPSLALAAAVACLAPAAAGALQLGTLERPTAFSALECNQPTFGVGSIAYQSITLPGLPSSRAPYSGSISSWSTDQFGSGTPGGQVGLVILTPGTSGVTVRSVHMETLPARILRGATTFTPSPAVPIAGGDYIGVYGPDDRAGCVFSGGESNEQATVIAAGSTLSAGASFSGGPPTVLTINWYRANVSAELGAGPGPPLPPTPPLPPLPPLPPVPPLPPTIGPDGRPIARSKGRDVEVDTGYSASCPGDPGPCVVVSTAVTYYGTGGVYAASAAASRGARARRRGRARRARPVVVGRRTFSVAPGASADVTFLLNRAGRRALARFGRLRLTVTTTVTKGTATPVVARRTFTIRAPRSGRRGARRRSARRRGR